MAKMFEIHGHHGQSPKFSLFIAFLCDNFFESGHETLKLRKSHGHWFLNMATLATPWPQLATLICLQFFVDICFATERFYKSKAITL